MNVFTTELEGVVRIEPKVFGDTRGFFMETWSAGRYEEAGVAGPFKQDNLSRSSHATLRGLHLQHPHGQGKLVSVLEGEVFDVAVDVRVGSPTFGRWVGARLSSNNRHQLFVPAGFAHGFCVTSDSALFAYKCTEYYHPETEVTIAWDDPAIGVAWPIAEPLLSERDRTGESLANVDRARLPRYGD